MAFDLNTVTIGDRTRDRVAELIKGKEQKTTRSFCKPSSFVDSDLVHNISSSICSLYKSHFDQKLKDMRAEIMAIFENPDITTQIERNLMVYFLSFWWRWMKWSSSSNSTRSIATKCSWIKLLLFWYSGINCSSRTIVFGRELETSLSLSDPVCMVESVFWNSVFSSNEITLWRILRCNPWSKVDSIPYQTSNTKNAIISTVKRKLEDHNYAYLPSNNTQASNSCVLHSLFIHLGFHTFYRDFSIASLSHLHLFWCDSGSGESQKNRMDQNT